MNELDFGTDIFTEPDLTFKLVRGHANLAYALLRRLTTPRGGLFYAPTYGIDIRDMLNAKITDEFIQSWAGAIASECKNDPRVEDVSVGIAATDQVDARLLIRIGVSTAIGPFTLIIKVSDLAATLIME